METAQRRRRTQRAPRDSAPGGIRTAGCRAWTSRVRQGRGRGPASGAAGPVALSTGLVGPEEEQDRAGFPGDAMTVISKTRFCVGADSDFSPARATGPQREMAACVRLRPKGWTELAFARPKRPHRWGARRSAAPVLYRVSLCPQP